MELREGTAACPALGGAGQGDIHVFPAVFHFADLKGTSIYSYVQNTR